VVGKPLLMPCMQQAPKLHRSFGMSAPLPGASGLRGPGDPLGSVMSDRDIADTLAAYASAAADAVRLGFDAIEIHGAHGYLIDQFLWAATNLRTDSFGGKTARERTRFAVEVVKAIRRAVPANFPVFFRFSQFKQQDYSVKLADTPQELATLLEPLTDAGVDVFHASQRKFWDPEFAGSDLNIAGWARRVTGRPAITVGSVGLSGDFQGNWKGSVSEPASIDNLLARLERGEFELVAVGRALLSDPQWADKVEHGRFDELRSFNISALGDYH
jgi:2,4-dienoyl-CoA reductase-like NADH-dependent reductase (Old Yellow Enzyme family)